MIRVSVFTLCLLFSFLVSFSQQLVKSDSIITNATFFSVDNFGNIFTVTNGGVIKYNAEGKQLHSFSNKGSGEIDFIDATNPLRILAYAKNFSIIYFLDNHLALQSTLDLRKQLYNDVWPVCNSTLDGFWIYQMQNFQLIKLNQNLQAIAQSQPLNLTVADDIYPSSMQEGQGFLVVLNPSSGFMIFDRLGSYFKTLKKTDVAFFTVRDNEIIFLSESKLITIDIKTGSEEEYNFSFQQNIKGFDYYKNKVYLLTTAGIEVYSYSK